ncbi:MAG: Lrp/AsnC family transcriptional regulator [Actinomycetaceae bacterium]|nr:Lrp/AsnC family transcriptional regulator [Actinomycetaceae bacterium]
MAYFQLDETDKVLVRELQADGRATFRALADRVGLSEAPVRRRVLNLIDEGVIQIVGVTDPTHVGFERQALLAIRVTGPVLAVADKLAAIPEVVYVVVTSGSYDITAEVVCKDDAALLELTETSIRTIEGVASMEILSYLRLHKQSYNWGTL